MKIKNAEHDIDQDVVSAYDDAAFDDEAGANPASWESQEREEQVLLALAGDADAAALINAHLEAFPEAEGRLGNPGHHALDAIIRKIAGSDMHIAEAL